MALIACPHCGKEVSDKAERCVHCGEIIVQYPPKPKNYDDFSTAEKDSLILEFEREHPEYSIRKAVRKKKIQTAILSVLGSGCHIVTIIMLFLCVIGVDKFYEAYGIHLQGNFESTDFTQQELGVFYRELGTDDLRYLHSNNETIIISSENANRALRGMVVSIFAAFLVGIVGIIAAIMYFPKYRKAEKKVLLNIKLYQAWLAKKEIQYEPRLSDRLKKRMNSINITKYRI